MTTNPDRINDLLEKLDALRKRQDEFSKEINDLKEQIYHLSVSTSEEPATPQVEFSDAASLDFVPSISKTLPDTLPPIPSGPKSPVAPAPPQRKSDLEKFVGENLINKIGIAITVIGVAIGAKYSIDHDLISPLIRIILGYLAGLGLLVTGFKLRKKYDNYSAVLVSGAIAILYFMTFAAYSFYAFFPQIVAFGLMVAFTIFTVLAAISYNKQVIAHIGLVGAYAIPFLLSESQENAGILFTYMAIINAGILVIAFKKYWKSLYYASFLLTWLIFATWYSSSYQVSLHFALALIFLFIFFIIFYVIFLAYKLVQHEKFEIGDIVLLLSNSFVFYGLGYSILESHPTASELLGLFTIGNAVIHGIASGLIHRQKLVDRNLFLLVAGLVMVFITMAIPVQLDGNWVTLLWAFEAVLLFWIGRTKNAPIYERLSHALIFLTIMSLVQDWMTAYQLHDPVDVSMKRTPVFNIQFLTSILCATAFAFINFLQSDKKFISQSWPQKATRDLMAFSIPAILMLTLYYSFRMEIAFYWDFIYHEKVTTMRTSDPENWDFSQYDYIRSLKLNWILNYSIVFFVILSLVNILKIQNKRLGLINLGINVMILLIFLGQGLYMLGALRESYTQLTTADLSGPLGSSFALRYLTIALGLILLVVNNLYLKKDFMKPITSAISVGIEILLHLSLLWIASSEVMMWMEMKDSSHSTKLGLSILWGIYALILIALGIWKKKKHLRIAAIVLFGITLVKLFVYDISQLESIAKTIIFVSLGLLLLIISFLYHKYKDLINEEDETPSTQNESQLPE